MSSPSPFRSYGLLSSTSAAMVAAVLPAYLGLERGFGPATYGALAGAATLTGALARFAGGYLADRTPGRRAILGFGSLVSAAARSLVLLGAAAVAATGVVVDDGARGLPTTAFSALTRLTGTANRTRLASMLGPTAALGIAALGGSFQLVIAMSALVSAVAGVLALRAPDVRRPLPPRQSVSPSRIRRAWALCGVRADAARAFALGAAFGSLDLGVLLLQHRAHLDVRWFPAYALAVACLGSTLRPRAVTNLAPDELVASAIAIPLTARALGSAISGVLTGCWLQQSW
ncbi:MAG: MFS transporter [Marmoricola sp.]